MAAMTPHPDDFGPRGERFPPLDLKGLLLGAGLTAGLTIAGLKALQPKYGQGTGPRSNTPTARSEVAVMKRPPQIVLTQMVNTGDSSHPLGYTVSVAEDATTVLIGKNQSSDPTISIDKNSELRIGKSGEQQIEILAKSATGADAKLMLDVDSAGNNLPDDVNPGLSYLLGAWTITPVEVDIGGSKGTFYVRSK